MSNDNTLKPYQVNIPANSEQLITITGNTAINVGTTDDIYISFDSKSETYFPAGFAYPINEGETYREIRLINNTGSTVTGTVILGLGRLEDRRFYSSNNLSTNEILADTIDDLADLVHAGSGAETVLTSNLTRKEAFITNLTGAVIRVGNAPTATRGTPIANGATGVFTGTYELKAYSSGGGSIARVWTEKA